MYSDDPAKFYCVNAATSLASVNKLDSVNAERYGISDESLTIFNYLYKGVYVTILLHSNFLLR